MLCIGIVGSRKRDKESDYEMVKEYLFNAIHECVISDCGYEFTRIVSGGAEGIDTIAERLAKELGIETIIHEPKRHEYSVKGNDIYFERNKLIAIDSDILLAFPIGMKGGTMNTIKHFKDLGKEQYLFIQNQPK